MGVSRAIVFLLTVGSNDVVFPPWLGASRRMNHGARYETLHAAGTVHQLTERLASELRCAQSAAGVKDEAAQVDLDVHAGEQKVQDQFRAVSIENLDMEGKQKVCTPDGVPRAWNR